MTEAQELEITAFDWVPDFARGFVRDLRLRWACEEAELPYSVRLISAIKRPEWFYEEQPWGQVPVLRDGDISLFESGACLLHIGEKNDVLLARCGQARADGLSWLFAALNSIEPTNFEMANIAIFAKGEEWAERRRPSLEKAAGARFDRVETAMRQKTWLAGDSFSIADIMMATVLREAERNGILDGRPVLSDYLARAIERPAFAKSLADQLRTFDENVPQQVSGE